MKELKVTLLHPNAKLPTRATDLAAGLDLYALEDFVLPAAHTVGKAVHVGRYRARTGIAVHLAPGYEGQVRPRSGLGFNDGITVFLGTIDADYQGEINVLLFNTTIKERQFFSGDRIAQLVISPVAMPVPVLADKPAAPTKRGTGGLGHTGR